MGVLAVATITDRTYQICVLALTILAYGALISTFSRAAYIAGLAGGLVLVWQRYHGQLSRRHRKMAMWGGVGALAVTLVGIFVVSSSGRALGVRNEAWSASIEIAMSNPLGVGLGRAGAVVNAHIDGTEEFVHVHNLWLNWLVEAGVIGFAAIAAITFGALVSAVGLAREQDAIGYPTFAALLGFLMMSLMDHPSNLSRVSVAFWLVLGVVMARTPTKWRVVSAAVSKSAATRFDEPVRCKPRLARVDPAAETRPISMAPIRKPVVPPRDSPPGRHAGQLSAPGRTPPPRRVPRGQNSKQGRPIPEERPPRLPGNGRISGSLPRPERSRG
nr:O-antigen ligase family protein [Amycolatopsis sp. SID8362]